MSASKITKLPNSGESADQVNVQEYALQVEEGLSKIDCLLRVLRDYSFKVLEQSEIQASQVESIYVMAESLKEMSERVLSGEKIYR